MRNSPQQPSLVGSEIHGVLNDVLGLFHETERVIASHDATAECLQRYASNLGQIRMLLSELAGYGGNDAEDADATVNARYLAQRCLDLEGRVKELRNDQLGR